MYSEDEEYNSDFEEEIYKKPKRKRRGANNQMRKKSKWVWHFFFYYFCFSLSPNSLFFGSPIQKKKIITKYSSPFLAILFK